MANDWWTFPADTKLEWYMKPRQSKPDWWYTMLPDHSSRFYRASKWVALKLIETQLSPADPNSSFRVSWAEFVIYKMGINLFNRRDWNAFWMSVSMNVTSLYFKPATSRWSIPYSERIKKEMLMEHTNPNPTIFRQALIENTFSLEEVRWIADMLGHMLSDVAWMCEQNNQDFPSWYTETKILAQDFRSAYWSRSEQPITRFKIAMYDEGEPVYYSSGFHQYYYLSIDTDKRLLLVNSDEFTRTEFTTDEARQLAYALLEAAERVEYEKSSNNQQDVCDSSTSD